MKILGIETSCDETAVAVVDEAGNILSHQILSQIEEHTPYGGVVPEIASRAHMCALDSLITKSMQEAGLKDFEDLSGIAVTAGPGLIGGVIVGVMMAKGLAAVSGVPIIPVNHLEGHALTIRLTDKNVKFPFLLLLVSGGHCQILIVKSVGQYELLGASLDDALGEAFDKVAKMMGLGYPGGPIVEKKASLGDNNRFEFPRSMVGKDHCNFSFSGLKTAVKRQIDALLQEQGRLNENDIHDICASFQTCVGDILVDRIKNAINKCSKYADINTLVISGGVAANQYIKQRLTEICSDNDFAVKAPPIKLCTDNGAMIAWAGIEKLQKGHTANIDFTPRARWPLCEGT